MNGHILTVEDKKEIIDKVINKGCSMAELSREYKIPSTSIRQYVHRFRNGQAFSENGGRAPCIDESSKIKLLESISGPICSNTPQFESNVMVAVEQSLINQGRSPSLAKMPSNRTIQKFIIKNDLMRQNVEPVTNARHKAVNDIFNAISFAVMNQTIVPLCEPQLIINYDATQYQVGYHANELIECIVLRSEKYKKKKVFKDPLNQGITAYFIKWMCVINACGETSDIVFLVADSSMDDTVIDVVKVPGLSCSSHVGALGYIVFCKSRAGNLFF